jgi:hypothetical protein
MSMRLPGPLSLIRAALVFQVLAFIWEGLWHGVLNPAFEAAATVDDMRHHLVTVHIPFYASILGLLLATGWALAMQAKRRRAGLLLPIAFAAVVGQAVGQAWDVWGHLRLSSGGPIAWALMALAPLVVLVALVIESRRAS